MVFNQDLLDENVSKKILTCDLPNELNRIVQPNIHRILKEREIGLHRRNKNNRSIRRWVETESVIHHKCQYYNLPDTTKSTISICFSPDGTLFASTHGDHTVKIINYITGEIVQTLIGHPRTPWTVKFHPTNPNIVASGCLGYEAKVWDIKSGRCLYSAVLNHAIISLSFHPRCSVIAIASGNLLYTWHYEKSIPSTAWQSEHTLRCVLFPPHQADKIIIGEANEPVLGGAQQAQTELTVKLSIWNFNLAWAIDAYSNNQFPLRPISGPKVILSTALLYNDGGFDVSTCGRYLSACADFSSLIQNSASSSPLDRHTSYASLRNDILDERGRSPHFPINRLENDLPIRRVRARLAVGRLREIAILEASMNQSSTNLAQQQPKNCWLVLISLEGDQLGSIKRISHLYGSNAGGVTSVKLSPSSGYVLLGYGVRERQVRINGSFVHRVTSIYRWEDMKQMAMLNSETDDVNIALFHPKEGYGFLYATKQGKLRAVYTNRQV